MRSRINNGLVEHLCLQAETGSRVAAHELQLAMEACPLQQQREPRQQACTTRLGQFQVQLCPANEGRGLNITSLTNCVCALVPKCPPQLNGDKISFGYQAEIRARDNLLPISIPNDEKIIAWLNRPAKAIVRTDTV
jgi:hypothetical protein